MAFRGIHLVIGIAVVLLGGAASTFAKLPDHRVTLTRVAFGSCNFQRFSQSHWGTIAELGPQLWIWGGDIIYADHLGAWLREGEYNHLKYNEHYQKLVQSSMIVGTWDDHDYGSNNTGKGFGGKKESQQLLLDFLDEPKDSPRRSQEGVYASYVFGKPGRQVKVILLDMRYFRDDPGVESDPLGKAQWRWLENELLRNDAQVTLLVSSSQMISFDDHGENWGEYPKARAYLYSMLEQTRGKLVILSGDRHFAEITRMKLRNGRPIYDFTSSGLTHSSSSLSALETDKHRVGPRYPKKNFGFLEIDWNDYPVRVNMQIRSTDGGEVAFAHKM